MDEDYRFLAAADLAAMASFLIWSALLALDCFCEDFFWLDFGDLSPMIFLIRYGIDCLGHVIFSAGRCIVLADAAIVNAGWVIILRGNAVRAGGFTEMRPKDSSR